MQVGPLPEPRTPLLEPEPLTEPEPSASLPSKTALLEGLEVDQYMLGILVYIQK